MPNVSFLVDGVPAGSCTDTKAVPLGSSFSISCSSEEAAAAAARALDRAKQEALARLRPGESTQVEVPFWAELAVVVRADVSVERIRGEVSGHRAEIVERAADPISSLDADELRKAVAAAVLRPDGTPPGAPGSRDAIRLVDQAEFDRINSSLRQRLGPPGEIRPVPGKGTLEIWWIAEKETVPPRHCRQPLARATSTTSSQRAGGRE